jgi:hypothetical protein
MVMQIPAIDDPSLPRMPMPSPVLQKVALLFGTTRGDNAQLSGTDRKPAQPGTLSFAHRQAEAP